MSRIINEIRNNVENDRLQKAFELLFDVINKNMLRNLFANRLKTLRGDFNRIKRIEQLGTESFDTINRQFNRVRIVLLELIDEVESEIGKQKLKQENFNVETEKLLEKDKEFSGNVRNSNNENGTKNDRPRSNYAQIISACVALVALLFAFYNHSQRDSNTNSFKPVMNNEESSEVKESHNEKGRLSSSLKIEDNECLDFMLENQGDFFNIISNVVKETVDNYNIDKNKQYQIRTNFTIASGKQVYMKVNLFYVNLRNSNKHFMEEKITMHCTEEGYVLLFKEYIVAEFSKEDFMENKFSEKIKKSISNRLTDVILKELNKFE